MISLIAKCIRFREMLGAFIRREMRQRYVGSILGRAWPFLQPLLILAVYYLVFVRILQVRLGNAEWTEKLVSHYGTAAADSFQLILLCAGLIPWLITAEYVARSANTILENGALVKKVVFPSELLCVYQLGAQMLNLMIMLSVFCTLTYTLTPFISPLLYLLPLVIILHGVMILGLAYLLATANVFIRDVSQLTPIFVNLWFFLTPIVYVKEMLPKGSAALTWLFDYNPMAHLVDLYRWCLIYPEEIRLTVDDAGMPIPVEMSDVMTSFGIVFAFATVFFTVGYYCFMSKKNDFADEL